MIKITDKYFIDATPNCYILKEKSIIKDENSKNFGEEIYRESGYYTTIESLLNGILKNNTREFISEDKIKSLKSLLTYLKKQDELINSFRLDI